MQKGNRPEVHVNHDHTPEPETNPQDAQSHDVSSVQQHNPSTRKNVMTFTVGSVVIVFIILAIIFIIYAF